MNENRITDLKKCYAILSLVNVHDITVNFIMVYINMYIYIVCAYNKNQPFKSLCWHTYPYISQESGLGNTRTQLPRRLYSSFALLTMRISSPVNPDIGLIFVFLPDALVDPADWGRERCNIYSPTITHYCYIWFLSESYCNNRLKGFNKCTPLEQWEY